MSAVREVDCPRCMETCGWCGDYRWMHGQVALPGGTGHRRYCTIDNMAPDAACAVCGGSKRVMATTTYRPLPDGGEAVHARPLSAASADPKNSLSPPTVEVGGVPEGWVLVPREPPTELLVSMAVRQDHGLGVPGYYDQPIFGAENLGHHRRMESALSDMRKLYEEVVGDGFYAPEHAERYRELIPAAPSREADDAPR